MRSGFKYIFIIAAVLLALTLLFWGCGDPPTTAVEQRGSIEISGFLLPDTNLAKLDTTDVADVDSINIKLDDDSLGYFDNPYKIENVIAGIHQLQVISWWRSEILDSSFKFQRTDVITVEPKVVNTEDFYLIRGGPYIGNPAHDFELYDLNSNLVSLSGSAGKVVLLYFFAYS